MKRVFVLMTVVVMAMLMTAGVALAGTIELISVNSEGQQADNFSWEPFVSGDGTVVVFHSQAENLDPSVDVDFYGLYLRDLKTGTTEYIMYDIDGSPTYSGDSVTSINSDGTFVAYRVRSYALGKRVMFVHDRTAGTLEVASLDSEGNPLYVSERVSISEDGRYAAFGTRERDPATNRTVYEVYVRDRADGVSHKVLSKASFYDMSADGAKLLVYGRAGDLVPDYPEAAVNVYVVHDWVQGTSELVNVDANGNLVSHAHRPRFRPYLSADGKVAAFPGVIAGNGGVVVRDMAANTTELASVDGAGTPMKAGDNYAMSDDGSHVAFVVWDGPDESQVYVRDRIKGTTELVSVSAEGVPGNGECYYLHINADGNVIVFMSGADNLVPDDTNETDDIFMVRLNTLPQTPEQAVEYIAGLVDSGVIDSTVANGLIPKLDSAQAATTSTAFDGKLQAFINQVNARIKTGKIDAETGAILIEAAQAMIDSN